MGAPGPCSHCRSREGKWLREMRLGGWRSRGQAGPWEGLTLAGGLEGALSSARAAMPNARARSWGVRGPHRHPGWDPASSGGCSSQLLPAQHKGWKRDGARKTRQLLITGLPARFHLAAGQGAGFHRGLEGRMLPAGTAGGWTQPVPSQGEAEAARSLPQRGWDPSPHRTRVPPSPRGAEAAADAPPLREAGEGPGWGFAERGAGAWPRTP